MNDILHAYVLRKENWDGIQLSEEARNRLEAIQTLTKSFEKGVFEDGSKNKLFVITPDIFNEHILRSIVEHMLREFHVPIPRDTTYMLLNQLQNIPEEIAEMVLHDDEDIDDEDIDAEDIHLACHRDITTCGLVVRRAPKCGHLDTGHAIYITPVKLNPSLKTMAWWHRRCISFVMGPIVTGFMMRPRGEEQLYMSSRTLLQELEYWHGFLSSTHTWQACKFEADMRAVAEYNHLSLSVSQCHLHEHLRYVFVLDHSDGRKARFLVIDVSELGVCSFLLPLKYVNDNTVGRDLNVLQVPNYYTDRDFFFPLADYWEWQRGDGIIYARPEEAFFLHQNIIKVFKGVFTP